MENEEKDDVRDYDLEEEKDDDNVIRGLNPDGTVTVTLKRVPCHHQVFSLGEK